ncbi:hypothetical protein MSAN_00968400 [Mycena sanguinolenta]|uniref:Uncharacterized protein n=1 Tax=Mycena sanguinolenta TaxID=230812 RepID=A0A8H7D9C7_9AGAR|nr:hypothetical protein MSAN_00968400 [Mycena sanguinolenta]
MKQGKEARIACGLAGEALREEQHRLQNTSRDVPNPYDDYATDTAYADDVSHGRTMVDISHAGEDLSEDTAVNASQSLLEQLRVHHNQLFPHVRNNRKRTNRTQIRIDTFKQQMDAMVNAFMHRSLEAADQGLGPSQFSIALDLYLAICAEADRRVQAALGRDSPNWRLKNACPACLSKLEGEDPIPLPLLVTMDGNNSLKRFWR